MLQSHQSFNRFSAHPQDKTRRSKVVCEGHEKACIASQHVHPEPVCSQISQVILNDRHDGHGMAARLPARRCNIPSGCPGGFGPTDLSGDLRVRPMTHPAVLAVATALQIAVASLPVPRGHRGVRNAHHIAVAGEGGWPAKGGAAKRDGQEPGSGSGEIRGPGRSLIIRWVRKHQRCVLLPGGHSPPGSPDLDRKIHESENTLRGRHGTVPAAASSRPCHL